VIEEEKHETTVGNPCEKDFAAEKIAVRDFVVEGAERGKRKKLRGEGWETQTPGSEFEAADEGSGKGKGKEKEVVGMEVDKEDRKGKEDWKGKEEGVTKEDGTGEA
jgi:hypothetical protein